MPKKTKKDKILAEVRAKAHAEKLNTYKFVKPQSDLQNPEKTNINNFNSEIINITTRQLQTNTLSFEDKLLKADLVKILVFTFFALASQGMIYYFLRG